ncbi:MAG: hypothetical protein KF886_17575 [Candidatus Hydrogenedentes bacterium]|nr:hypothetical protein [Candidatus Hydrogenedentota bacterium]
MRVTLSQAAKRECALVACVFLTAAIAGMVYVSTWGQTADILQASFGPSVMLACGQGFVNPKAADVPELAAFLQPELHRDGPPLIDAFDCALLPPDLETVPFTGIHRRTWHMFYIAGWVWRVFGVAWSSLTPLYGLLYGLSAAAAYGLFRLLLNRPLALFCAGLFLMSPVQLHFLPRLRDFAKAPFMLIALFCLVLLLTRPAGWRRALWCGAAAGAAIGLATGFRAEAVMYLFVFVPAVLLFYPGWRPPAMGCRAIAVTAFLICFLLAGWPVLMKFQTYGERTHPFLMGFAGIYDARLGVDHPAYQVAWTDLDTEALAMHNAHNRYLDDAAKPIIYETPGYEAVGDDYFFRNLLWTLPGDLATRTAAAGLRILDELRPNPEAYMPREITHHLLEPIYAARARLMETVFSRTRYVALALLLILGAIRPRLGFLALYLAFCLAGMASVQFASRHYFHLEVFPLLAGGLVLQFGWWVCTLVRKTERVRFLNWIAVQPEDPTHRAIAAALPPGHRARLWARHTVKQGLYFAIGAAALVLVPWYVLCWHQDRQLQALFDAYAASERDTVWPVVREVAPGEDGPRVLLALDPVTRPGGLPEAGPAGYFDVDMLVLRVASGDAPVRLTFRYAGDTSERDLTWYTDIPPAPDGAPVEFYAPVYNAIWPDTPDNATWGDLPPAWTRFEGIEVSAGDLPRLAGVERFRYAAGYTPLIGVQLNGAAGAPWVQRFTR